MAVRSIGGIVYAIKGSSMDDAERGVKQSRVTVKISLKYVGTRDMAHTERLFRERKCLFLVEYVVPSCHESGLSPVCVKKTYMALLFSRRLYSRWRKRNIWNLQFRSDDFPIPVVWLKLGWRFSAESEL
jgi:hypothetical protein